jgi:hypothetical protein
VEEVGRRLEGIPTPVTPSNPEDSVDLQDLQEAWEDLEASEDSHSLGDLAEEDLAKDSISMWIRALEALVVVVDTFQSLKRSVN